MSDARPCEDAPEQISDLSPDLVDRRQCIRLIQYIERGLRGRQSNEIRGVGSPVNDAPPSADDVHHISAAAKACDWIAVAHGLGVGREICMDAVVLLRTPLRDAKACLHLVDNQHGAVPGRGVAEGLQPLGSG